MNKLKIFVSSLFLCLLSFSIVTAQEGDVNLEELLNGQVTHVNNLLYSNLSFIQQIGNENMVISYQNWQGLLPNVVNAEQHKQGNDAIIEQTGSGHETKLFQNGAENVSRLLSEGENIKVAVTQNGDGNLINSYIENHGLQTRLAEFMQQGNFNKIELSLKGDGFPDRTMEQRVVINQYGNSHELNAVMDPFSAPLEITQEAGASGEGMTVNITTSAFSFPMK